MKETMEHRINYGRLWPKNTYKADCTCGWSYEGTKTKVRAALQAHNGPLIESHAPEPPLADYYNATSVGNLWHLHCKKCDMGWSLPKNNKHPGNLLHLLNHARSHDARLQKQFER